MIRGPEFVFLSEIIIELVVRYNSQYVFSTVPVVDSRKGLCSSEMGLYLV